ncbi:glycosyltransferase [Synechococcus sp. EJ6-Ellesmere]|uniref:glycosyltransferase family 2 protein n=1 Tax=Synechococcus sp. EJ6-Ellesmere TaxID=2823734 RepID=UPI0020CD800A|nr:glycosyltransferase [Synechococcus sp. EJ6-Ellesmere]MCP9826036.1 glycosyltransferase [Synechococcus sp. EJ6-Ellesmere]
MSIALCIPAYNAADCLPRLLKSALGQTKLFNEIWVYDDCSVDKTASVASGFGAQVIRGAINKGCSHGKNALVNAVSSEWIHFHDADDDLLPSFVKLAQRWVEKDCADVILFNYNNLEEGTGRLLGHRIFDPILLEKDPRAYAISEQINPFCGLYRKSAYLEAGGYDEDPAVLYNEDVAFHIRLAFAGLKFAVEPEVAIINYTSSSSMSQSNKLGCLQAHLAVLVKTAEHPEAHLYYHLVAKKLWHVAGLLGSYLDWNSADRAIDMAINLAPLQAAELNPWLIKACQVSPHLTYRLREASSRLFKPALRSGYPRRGRD